MPKIISRPGGVRAPSAPPGYAYKTNHFTVKTLWVFLTSTV